MASIEGSKKRKHVGVQGEEGRGNAVASSSRPALPPIVGHDDEPVSSKLKRKEKTGDGKTVKEKQKKKGPASPGIVYISRLPPGMTPQKVRHLMARWGEVGKVFAQPRAPTAKGDKKPKHTAANYSEAWVEFLDKSVAKMAARLLNAQVIGGKPGDKWREDIWTMKYLSGFKWEMLGEQVAYERQAHQSRLRAEIAKSRTEQSEYLRNVELARVLDKRKARKTAAGAPPAPAGEDKGKDTAEDGRERKRYKQRQVVDKGHGLEAKGMDSVLGSVFG